MLYEVITNPIAVKYGSKTWQADLPLAYVNQVYKDLENLLGVSVYTPVNIKKVLGVTERDIWKKHIVKRKLTSHVSIPERCEVARDIEAPNGYALISTSSRLDIPTLVASYRLFLEEQNGLLDEEFNERKLVVSDHGVEYNGCCAEKIVFCRGAWDEKSTFFKNLKFSSTKGEVLEVNVPSLILDTIYSKGVFSMPLKNGNFKIGATYDHEWSDLLPSEAKRDELLEKWSVLCKLPADVVQHLCGIRPTMEDRRPVAGFLNDNPRVGILNGLGSRGALIAPWLSNVMALHIRDSTHFLSLEVDVNRYNG